MSLYDRLAATAAALLEKYGQDVTVRNYTTGTYNPATGQNAMTSSDSTRKGALFSFGKGQALGPGGLVQVGDKKLLLEAGSSAPSLEDNIVVGGEVYVVKGIEPADPAGTPVLYTLHLGKG